MKKVYKNLQLNLPWKFSFLFILCAGIFISCSIDDEIPDIEENKKQNAVISFDPEFFGQSFYTAPDSTHIFKVYIKKGQKTATGFKVYEKIISEGVLVQNRVELQSYSQQLSGTDNEEISIEYHVSEERKNNDKITLEFVVLQEEDEIMEALVIEVQKEQPQVEPIQQINDIIYYTQLALGGQDNSDTGSFFNIETAAHYNLPEASNDQENIDFAMLVGASTGINFLAPASSGFQFFGAEIKDAVYNGWEIKNDGEFINIGNVNTEETFEDLEYTAQIIEAYETAKEGIETLPGYVSNENGPGDRIRKVQIGDVIFFRNEAGTIAVLKITSMLPDTGGIVEFEMKTAVDPNAEPQEPGEIGFLEDVEIGGQDNTEVGSYFNLNSQTSYNLEDATAIQGDIDLIMLVGGSTGVNFLAPASSGLQYFGSDIKEAVYNGWTTKNSGQFVNIGNSGTASIFDGISSEEGMQSSFETALAEVEDMDGYVENENGPGDRIRKVKVDDVIFFQTGDGRVVAMKITQLANDTSGSVKFDLKTVN